MHRPDTRSKLATLDAAWTAYRKQPSFDHFVEFALGANSLADVLRSGPSAGLARLSQDLEQEALALFGSQESHPIAPDALERIDQQIKNLSQILNGSFSKASQSQRHMDGGVQYQQQDHSVWLLTDESASWHNLAAQLGYFGLDVQQTGWHHMPVGKESIMLVTPGDSPERWARLHTLRSENPASQIIALGVPPEFELFRDALRHGCDHCFPREMGLPAIVAHILELQEARQDEPYRILIVDDSLTAHALIRRALAEQGIETRAITDPAMVLEELHAFAPDLLLLDMYMPACNGVEVARVIRQHPEFLSIPIVYLSGETDLALQVEALRLGGDHFLTKPFNPVFLNAIVKSKIERYRALRRSMYHDSLTGLLNHTSSKSQLEQSLDSCRQENRPLCVAMLDIDHFKQVNDKYGHPVGDQIIRSLAWLLKQRVRRNDILGRYGGEEFLLALPGANLSQAYATMELIRQDFAAIRHPYGDTFFQLSFSCGMAAFPGLTNSDDLINAADEALYRAKRGGRNRVECA